jgi:tetratricopeptide (TPR) repeat protein
LSKFSSFSPVALALAALLALAACDTAEERAEEHFQSGLSLLDEGDVDRAVVEFRNALRLDPAHVESRRALADVLLEDRNDPRRAYRQYLRIAEQNPEDVEGRIVLSEIAFSLNSWEEVARHADVAERLAPEDPRVQAIVLARRYREAAQDDNASDMRDVARQVSDMLEEQPDNAVLRSVRADASLREGDFEAALEDIDWMLARDPSNTRLLNQRLAVLVQLNDTEGVEVQLREMIARFPDDDTQKATLLQFFLANDMTEKAEAYLRERVTASNEIEPKTDLVNFLLRVSGADAAEAQLDAFIAEDSDQVALHLLKAAITFDNGEQQEAMTRLEAVLREASETAPETLDAKVTLARMQLATGNEVGARAQVAEVLAQDENHPQALKLQAAWQIEADEVETAIANLRTVLDQEPEDAQAMSLMSQAYLRIGEAALAQDFLALAVEASENAPAETIRYVRLLMEQENYRSAEDFLLTALRRNSQNAGLLSALGDVYIATEDFGRLEQVITALRSFDTPQTTQAANGFEAERINQERGTADALAFLENLAADSDDSLTGRLTLVQARLRTGEIDSALQEIRQIEAENPGNSGITYLRGVTELAAGNLDTSEALLRQVVTENPQIGSNPWIQLARLKTQRGDVDAAHTIVDEALTHLPEDGNLLWAKASYLEQNNDIDGAIAIYEDLYERNSSSVVIANNLASMLSTYKSDEESLERAWVVARRFRDTDIPQMQDTYGWILHRRGNPGEALPYLEEAAAALTRDPIVQYHLGRSYLAQDRIADAIEQFEKVVGLTNPADQRPQIVDARAQLATLELPAETEGQ